MCPATPAGAAPLPPPSAEIGDVAPNFRLPDSRAQPFVLRNDAIAGKPVALVFLADAGSAEAARELAAYRKIAAELAEHEVAVIAVSPDDPPGHAALKARLKLGIEFLSDPENRLRAVYGLASDPAPVTFLLGPAQRILEIFDDGEAGRHAGLVLEAAQRIKASRPVRHMEPHAPVLLVPDVLSRPECRRLIALWERQDVPVKTGADYREERGDFKMAVNDYGRVDRVDYIIQDRETQRFIDSRLGRRLIPEIAKAFQYRVTNRELFHIAGYEGTRGGFQHGHRDNPTPELAHRRFALSLNLNAEEYEGGELRFREYGEQLYKAPTGAALVFSSSLLHEVLGVRKGRRFTLLSHLFGNDGPPAQPTGTGTIQRPA